MLLPLPARSAARLRRQEVPLSETMPTVNTATSTARVASIVEHRSESAFALLLQLADRHFSDPGFEDALADSLRANATLVEPWETWSADQRWTPSAYVERTRPDGLTAAVRLFGSRGTEGRRSLISFTGWPGGCPGKRCSRSTDNQLENARSCRWPVVGADNVPQLCVRWTLVSGQQPTSLKRPRMFGSRCEGEWHHTRRRPWNVS